MEISELPIDKKIILFDGICNLCDSAVQFVIKHDKNDVFRFIALQSELGQAIISHIGIADKNIDSIVLYEPKKAYYYKAEAAIRIIQEFGGAFGIMKIFRALPKSVSNLIYDYIAKNRYKWYGKKDNCIIPTPNLKSKFLA